MSKGFIHAILPIIVVSVIIILSIYYVVFGNSSINPVSTTSDDLQPSPEITRQASTTTPSSTTSEPTIQEDNCSNRLFEYDYQVVEEGSKCKISQISSGDNTFYDLYLDKDWEFRNVGAAGINIHVQVDESRGFYIYNVITDASTPTESLSNSEHCYEGCEPVTEPGETISESVVLTYGDNDVLKLVSKDEERMITRFFVPTNYVSVSRGGDYRTILLFESDYDTDDVTKEMAEVLNSLELKQSN